MTKSILCPVNETIPQLQKVQGHHKAKSLRRGDPGCLYILSIDFFLDTIFNLLLEEKKGAKGL
jgi:hypothetical protein